MDLSYFTQPNFYQSLQRFFEQINIPINYLTAAPATAQEILTATYNPNNPAFQLIQDVYLVGGVDDNIFQQHAATIDTEAVKHQGYAGLLIFGITLKRNGKLPTRTQMAEITRALNREFHYTPVVTVFRYDRYLSLANCERIPYKQTWREGEKVGKVSLLKDIDIHRPHTGHLKILENLRIERTGKQAIASFEALYQYWQDVLSVSLLNKRFYQEVSNWYFGALQHVEFPDDLEKDKDVRNAKNLIRLLTRIIFIWFIKEKSLVPERLFDPQLLPTMLKHFLRDDQSSTYYQAILQNLFFATLNQKMGERAFVKEGTFAEHKKEYGVKTLLRYADQFRISKEEALALFADIPFLNGGLFDCLDKEDEQGHVVYVDGFSRNPKKRAHVPDFLFFMPQEQEVDLTAVYDPTSKKPILRKVRGLFDILNSYKFTVAENTPIEEEIALDPELLGKVFENLLASYNPETQTTARKQTGSFYTPREIVNYMVDESLIAHLKQAVLQDAPGVIGVGEAQSALFGNRQRAGQLHLEHKLKDNPWIGKEAALEDALREALGYAERPLPFDEADRQRLIAAINRCKILDPACGSGAFPMGVLHKLVHLLHKLDPDNQRWKQAQKERIIGEKVAELKRDKIVAEQLSDDKVREQAIQAIQDRLSEIEAIFDREYQFDDYARKLYLIENCIYGVDIQPIAVQIAKLRCFISLIIDQKKSPDTENFGLRALPNLETKFVAANTLIGLDKPKGHQMALKNQEIVQLENDLKALRHKYFTAKTRHEKLAAQHQDKTLRQQIARLLVNDGWDTNTAQLIVAFDPYDQNASAGFFEPEWMFGIQDGFDIVIGNPPYVSLNKYPKEFINRLKTSYERIHTGYNDVVYYFLYLSIELLKPYGVSVLITSNYFLGNEYAQKLRNYLKAYLVKLINFKEYRVFESASIHTCISMFKKISKEPTISYFEPCSDEEMMTSSIEEKCKAFKLQRSELKNTWIVAEEGSQQLIKKINEKSLLLGQISDIEKGPTSGKNNVFTVSQEQIREYKLEKELLRKNVKNSYIKKYYFITRDEWIIYIDNDTDITNYPNTLSYLSEHREVLENRNEVKQGAYSWYRFERPRRRHIFDADEKLIVPYRAEHNRFAYDNSQHFNNGGDIRAIVITDKRFHVKYVLALLNSSLLDWYYGFIGKPKGNAREYFNEPLSKIPIINASEKDQYQFVELVDQILAAKQQNPAADTRDFERRVDLMVYKLYDLIYDEVKIVDPNFTLSAEEYQQFTIEPA